MAALAVFISWMFFAYAMLVTAAIVLSWKPTIPRSRMGWRALRSVCASTEPFLAPFRRLVPPIGAFDLSPMVALVALGAARWLVIGSLGGA